MSRSRLSSRSAALLVTSSSLVRNVTVMLAKLVRPRSLVVVEMVVNLAAALWRLVMNVLSLRLLLSVAALILPSRCILEFEPLMPRVPPRALRPLRPSASFIILVTASSALARTASSSISTPPRMLSSAATRQLWPSTRARTSLSASSVLAGRLRLCLWSLARRQPQF